LDVVRVNSKPEFDDNGSVTHNIHGLDDLARFLAEKVNEGRSNALEQNRNLEIRVSDSVKRVHRKAEERNQTQHRDSEFQAYCLEDPAAEELLSRLKEAETRVVE
jgi:hypothetical protein